MPRTEELEAVEPYERLHETSPDHDLCEDYYRQQIPEDDPIVKYQYLLADVEPDCGS